MLDGVLRGGFFSLDIRLGLGFFSLDIRLGLGFFSLGLRLGFFSLGISLGGFFSLNKNIIRNAGHFLSIFTSYLSTLSDIAEL